MDLIVLNKILSFPKTPVKNASNFRIIFRPQAPKTDPWGERHKRGRDDEFSDGDSDQLSDGDGKSVKLQARSQSGKWMQNAKNREFLN